MRDGRTWVWIPCGLFLMTFALTLPGCQAPLARDYDTIPHSAYRPAFTPGPPRRTLFLGGYAGYNYGPVATQTDLPTVSGGARWGYPAARPLFGRAFER